MLSACIVISLSGCAADKGSADEGNNISKDTADVPTDSTGGGQSITDLEQPASTDTQISVPADSEPAQESENQPAVPDTQDEAAVPDSRSLYEQFLDNEVSATVSSSYPDPDYIDDIVQKGNSYTLTELGQRVSEYFLNPEYTDKTSYDFIQYAYVDCPDSAADDRNLLVKFAGLNIYTQDDDSYAVFVVTEDSGQLYLTYEYQCWARSVTTANANGILSSFGSGGAGDHYDGLSAILSDGTNANLYDAEILSGWWTSYVNDTIYSEVFGPETDPGSFTVSIYTIDNDKYYLYDISECTEEEKGLCESYIARCKEEQGINWSTEEEIQAAIKNRCSTLGIDSEITEQQQEAAWNSL